MSFTRPQRNKYAMSNKHSFPTNLKPHLYRLIIHHLDRTFHLIDLYQTTSDNLFLKSQNTSTESLQQLLET